MARRYCGLALTDIVELQAVPTRPHIVVGCSCTGALAVWDTWTRQLLAGLQVCVFVARVCACARALRMCVHVRGACACVCVRVYACEKPSARGWYGMA